MERKITFKRLYDLLLSDRTKERSEKVILTIAILSFLVHLTIIYLVDFGLIENFSGSDLLKNPIAAIYTPFSFILIYEVYLLIYYLPRSFTTYIGKQYEIITLIIIRRLFKDLSTLELSSDWFQIKGDLQFTYDLVASVLLFYLLYIFYVQSKKKYIREEDEGQALNIDRFIYLKKWIAVFLVPILLSVAMYTLFFWTYGTIYSIEQPTISFKNINNIFFDEFFTILIITDVILLLFSFFYTDRFHKVIRNSGFIISTILIRLSFSVDGAINTILIISAVIFGLVILTIHNQYEKNIID
ncbi:membrane protein [Sediminicola sp. YIK13]|uniref:hypothetical protein n=1 Tax=Sediminicola sp. YIK13 TaxID=1453352 RepID=UPI000720C875|nr:hypothetical protein [Sediminicola sp. YIK13]ALM08384.1 membrane protein [Sediminicola sp. YIK13]